MRVSLFVDRIIVGDGIEVVGKATVTLEHGLIQSICAGHVGTAGLDFSGCTLLPGFIDTHVHLSLVTTDDHQGDMFRMSPEERAIRAFVNAQKLLQAGFTTLRSAGDADASGVASLEIARLAEKKLVVAPRICGAGHYISITGGGGDLNAFRGRFCCSADGLVADGPEEMRKAVRKEIKAGSDWIKILATGAFMASSQHDSPDYSHFSSQELDSVREGFFFLSFCCSSLRKGGELSCIWACLLAGLFPHQRLRWTKPVVVDCQ